MATPEPIDEAIRILGSDGLPVGTGFLVSEQYALTCSSVVAAALGIDGGKPDEMPDGTISFDYPTAEETIITKARLAYWQPPGYLLKPLRSPLGHTSSFHLQSPSETTLYCNPKA